MAFQMPPSSPARTPAIYTTVLRYHFYGASRYSACASLQRELTGRAHVFKSAALQGIARAFHRGDGNAGHVFHAAFGNRETDLKAYASAGIDPARIFIVNERGEVKRSGALDAGDTLSYGAMMRMVDALFPARVT